MHQRIIDESTFDKRVVDELQKRIEHVTGCVVEMVETHPSTLLSPLFRELLLKEAKELQALSRATMYRLCIDNPVGDKAWKSVESLLTPIPSVSVPEKPSEQPTSDNPS
jgi:hypothetical protein